MSFRSVFLAVVVAFALILAAFLINRARPKSETEQPTADFVRATGKCAECHARTAVLRRPRIRDERATPRRASTASIATSPPPDRRKKIITAS